MRIYVPVSRTGLAMLSFAGPSEHADTIAAVADGVMETISMTDAGVEGFAQPRDQSLAKLLGVALGAAIPLVASVVALVFAFRRGKKAEPQARP
jgi:F0F1-type ATP synthase membrane subunit c/vacuolar-type H+-ATPase subunit K